MTWVKLIKASDNVDIDKALDAGFKLSVTELETPDEGMGIREDLPTATTIANIDSEYLMQVAEEMSKNDKIMDEFLDYCNGISFFNGYLLDDGEIFIDVGADSYLDDYFFPEDEENSNKMNTLISELKKMEQFLKQKIK